MILYSISFLVLSNAVTIRRDKSILYARISITVFICSVILCINSLNLQFIDTGIGLFGGLYQTTVITNSFHIFIFILSALILQLNSFYSRKVVLENITKINLLSLFFSRFIYSNKSILNKTAAQFKILEYPLIIIFIVLGASFLISSCDLISLFLSLELQSYGLYILCAVYRNSERSISGSLTYFLLGGLSSCFILLASGLLYGNSGNTSFDSIYIINNISSIVSEESEYNLTFKWYQSSYLGLSLIIMSVGFLFKVSAAPFHFWSPDVYDSIPTIVTTTVAILAKISIFVLLLELVYFTRNLFFNTNFSWTIVLLISSIISLTIGSLLGLTQFRIKRLYAYSTISHIGFILLALVINTIESTQSFIFYLIQYSLTNLNAFLLLTVIGFSLHYYKKKDSLNNTLNKPNKSIYVENILLDKENSPIQLISQLKGYFNINSYIALSLTITLFSFVGVPPLMGFFAKQMVLSSAIDNGYVFMTFIGILTSVVSAYYYLAIVKQMYFYNTDYTLNPLIKNTLSKGIRVNTRNNSLKNITIKLNDITISSSLTVTISVITLTILLFIIIPNEWLNMANILALILFNT